MMRHVRTFGIVVAAALLLAGCGNEDTQITVEDNDNTSAGTPTPIRTVPAETPTGPFRTPTAVLPTQTPVSQETATPGGSSPTSTPAGTTAVATETPGAAATATRTPTPVPTATAAGPTCGNAIKETGEECDTGTNFGAMSADCSGQCACCLCRPDSVHVIPGPKCSTCHPSIAPALTFPPGAAATFPGLCE